jgi:hypothetical protein
VRTNVARVQERDEWVVIASLSSSEVGVWKVEGRYERVGLESEKAAGDSLLFGIISLFAIPRRCGSSGIAGQPLRPRSTFHAQNTSQAARASIFGSVSGLLRDIPAIRFKVKALGVPEVSTIIHKVVLLLF